MFRCHVLLRRAVPGSAVDPSVLLVAALVLIYLVAASFMPHGESDAYAIWNLHAKLLLVAPEQISNPALEYSHPDYPPLLPAMIAAGWKVLGISPFWPILLHGMIYLSLLILMRRAVPRWWIPTAVGIILLPYATMQYADLLLAVCFLAAVVAYRARRDAWVGIALGFGLLTKNEGALMALAFLGTWVVFERRIPWRSLLPLAVAGGLLLLWKWAVGAPNDLVGAPGVLERLSDPWRWLILAAFVPVGLLTFGAGAIPLMSVAAWLDGHLRLTWSVPSVAVLVVFAGYLGIYLITPHDLIWHLYTSFDRLVLQLFPALVVCVIPEHLMESDR